MIWSRRQFAGLTLGFAAWPGLVSAQDSGLEDALLAQLFGTTSEHEAGLRLIADRGKPDMAAGLILALRFAINRQDAIGRTLERLTGQSHGTQWFDWMLWQERNPQIVPHPSYAAFMRDAHLRIDPNFRDFLRPEHLTRDAAKIRIEEIAWGGVLKDGIPSLDTPTMITASSAEYLRDDDLVFGISINGDARAYPLRIMGWHEMFNDVVGGVPVALAYCTLCGSGILFETQTRNAKKPLIFGSSGFLYRSNKLMFDRKTNSLWNQYTGQPVIGPLAGRGIKLTQRPVVITTWANWKATHPTTRVLSLKTGYRRDYGSGVVYSAYFGSPDLMFPALVDEQAHNQKDYVFTIRQFGVARAWPLNAFDKKRVINDAIANTPLVLIGNAQTRSVRAYERGDLTFASTGDRLTASDGTGWTATEAALVGPDGVSLSRVAGHISYWFAWDNYIGDAGTVYPG
ncbi:DUF3179 domain-containing protein [Actibacterium sp. 188UL27-1]|uniref:DUF3179 domain-containing protein n=1 Tax=Actibacterium sp. 188UL27-1 TaxID=2786961 RepID=UPI00195C0D10|nr:DUF3179 domain-containing protein [Actibacterium sp. 188UL27-1]MBM7066704.1 DUF3179 domain-containing protein [Actibacterium sp. 188UL27-1]